MSRRTIELWPDCISCRHVFSSFFSIKKGGHPYQITPPYSSAAQTPIAVSRVWVLPLRSVVPSLRYRVYPPELVVLDAIFCRFHTLVLSFRLSLAPYLSLHNSCSSWRHQCHTCSNQSSSWEWYLKLMGWSCDVRCWISWDVWYPIPSRSKPLNIEQTFPCCSRSPRTTCSGFTGTLLRNQPFIPLTRRESNVFKFSNTEILAWSYSA